MKKSKSKGRKLSHQHNRSMVSEDSKAGEQLYDALAEIIDDHMPDVFDEDLVEAY